jgi:DNA-binding transcriptional LysR family regulator
MDKLTCIKNFVSVVNNGGFMKAAVKTNLPVSTISKQIAFLEKWCNASLLHRTTRSVKLTKAGENFYNEAKLLLDKADELQYLSSKEKPGNKGIIRLSIPPTFNDSLLLKPIFIFLKNNPDVKLDISSRPYIDELFNNAADFVISLKKEHSVDVKGLKLFDLKRGFFASPDYLIKYGKINCIEDLEKHNCLVLTDRQFSNTWYLSNKKKIKVEGSVSSDHFNTLKAAAVEGIGVLNIAEYFIETELAKGLLVPILQEQQSIEAEIHIYYLRYRENFLIKSFLDHLKNYFIVNSKQ